uniref:Uncharacterized protein n=1 Tax=Ditylenchus dipsaci TaxID=166011 RepID=A0A915CWR8_9BILA
MASGLRQYYSAFSVLLNFVSSFAYLENDLSAVLSNFVNMNKTKERCWGFEADCPLENSYSRSHVKCLQRSRWPEANTEPKQVELFWKAGDFGSLKTRHSSIATICNSTAENGSLLRCSDHLRFCSAKNIFFNFKGLNAKNSSRYRTDVIGKGEAGGNCDFIDKQLLQTRADERGYLRSWADELIPLRVLP